MDYSTQITNTLQLIPLRLQQLYQLVYTRVNDNLTLYQIDSTQLILIGLVNVVANFTWYFMVVKMSSSSLHSTQWVVLNIWYWLLVAAYILTKYLYVTMK